MGLDNTTDENSDLLDQYGNWIANKPEEQVAETENITQTEMFSIPEDIVSPVSTEGNAENLFNIQIPDINMPDLENLDISAMIEAAESEPQPVMEDSVSSKASEDELIPDENDFSEISLDDFMTGGDSSSSFDEISLDDFMDSSDDSSTGNTSAKKADDDFYQNYDALDIDLVFDEAYLAEAESRKSSNIEDSNFNQFFSDDFGVELIDESGDGNKSFFPSGSTELDDFDLDAIPDMATSELPVAELVAEELEPTELVAEELDEELVTDTKEVSENPEPEFIADSIQDIITEKLTPTETVSDEATEFDDLLNELNSEPAGVGAVTTEIQSAQKQKDHIIVLEVSEEDITGSTVQTVQTMSTGTAEEDFSVPLYPEGYVPVRGMTVTKTETTVNADSDFDLSEIEGFEFLNDITPSPTTPEPIPEPEDIAFSSGVSAEVKITDDMIADIPVELEDDFDQQDSILTDGTEQTLTTDSTHHAIETTSTLMDGIDDIPLEEPEPTTYYENSDIFVPKGMQETVFPEYNKSVADIDDESPIQLDTTSEHNDKDIKQDTIPVESTVNEGPSMNENESTIFDDTESDMLPDFTVFTEDENNDTVPNQEFDVQLPSETDETDMPADDFSESGITIKEPAVDVSDDYTESEATATESLDNDIPETDQMDDMPSIPQENDMSMEFDDITAVINDISDTTPTPNDTEIDTSAITQDSASAQNEVLEKIASELSMIKAELATLKGQIAPSPATATVTETSEVAEKEGGFFADDDTDEAIALTGDELNNILITADFTDEGNEENTLSTEAENETTFDDSAIPPEDDNQFTDTQDFVSQEELTPETTAPEIDIQLDESLLQTDDIFADQSDTSENQATQEDAEISEEPVNEESAVEEPFIQEPEIDTSLEMPEFSDDTAPEQETDLTDSNSQLDEPLLQNDSAEITLDEPDTQFSEFTLDESFMQNGSAEVTIDEPDTKDDVTANVDSDVSFDMPEFADDSAEIGTTTNADDDSSSEKNTDTSNQETASEESFSGLDIEDFEATHITQVDDTSYLDNDDISGIDNIDQVAIDEPVIQGMDFDTENLEEPELDDLTLDFTDINQEIPAEMSIEVAPETEEAADGGALTFDDLSDITPDTTDGIDLADTESFDTVETDEKTVFETPEVSEETTEEEESVPESDGTENDSIITIQNLLEKEAPETTEEAGVSSAFDEFPTLDKIVLDDSPVATESEPESEPDTTEPETKQPLISDAIPGNLKDDIKSVLLYMDQLLDSLPEEKIEEFAKSEHFNVYKKLLDELELS